MTRRSLLCTLSLLLALPSLAAAAGWAPFGPAGFPLTGFVPGVAGRLFVSSAVNGVFASADGGRSWSWSGTGMGAARVQALAADTAGNLYASGPAAFFRSTDGGNTWTVLTRDLPLGPPIQGGDLLTVASNGTGGLEIFLARDRRLLRSTDGGATWQQVLTAFSFSALLVDPTDPRSVFAATARVDGMFHSGDGGATWEPVTQVDPPMGPPYDKPFSFGVDALAAAPTSPATLFAEMNLDLYRSTDGGVSWHLLPPTPEPSVGYVYAVTVLPGSPDTVYTLQQLDSDDGFAHGGIFASRDLGETWTLVNDNPNDTPFAGHLMADRATGDLFLQEWDVLARGAGHGAHWTSLLSFKCYEATSGPGELLRWPADGSRIYAEVGDGFSVSLDGGRSWIGRPQSPSCIADFRVDPRHAGTLYAGTFGGGVYASRDSGATWKNVLASADPRSFLDIWSIVIPRSGRIVAGGCGIWLSGDDGKSWTRTLSCVVHRPIGDYDRRVSRLVVDPAQPDILYADEVEISEDQTPPDFRSAILRSLDGGRTWHPWNGWLWPPIGNPGQGVAGYDLIVSQTDPRTLYAAGFLGVFRSRDGGLTWQPFGTGLGGRTPFSLFLDPGEHNLFTGAEGFFQLRLHRKGS